MLLSRKAREIRRGYDSRAYAVGFFHSHMASNGSKTTEMREQDPHLCRKPLNRLTSGAYLVKFNGYSHKTGIQYLLEAGGYINCQLARSRSLRARGSRDCQEVLAPALIAPRPVPGPDRGSV